MQAAVAKHDIPRSARQGNGKPVRAPDGLRRSGPDPVNHRLRAVHREEVGPLRPAQAIQFRRHAEQEHARRAMATHPIRHRFPAERNVRAHRPQRRADLRPYAGHLRPMVPPCRCSLSCNSPGLAEFSRCPPEQQKSGIAGSGKDFLSPGAGARAYHIYRAIRAQESATASARLENAGPCPEPASAGRTSCLKSCPRYARLWPR